MSSSARMDFRLFEFPAFTLLFRGRKNFRRFGTNKDENSATRDESHQMRSSRLFLVFSVKKYSLGAYFGLDPWKFCCVPLGRDVGHCNRPRWRITAPRFGVGWHAAAGPGEKCCWCLVQQWECVVKLWLIQMKWRWWWATNGFCHATQGLWTKIISREKMKLAHFWIIRQELNFI